MSVRLLPLLLALTLTAAPAFAMGTKPEASPPAEANPAASIADMEEAAGHVIMLGPRISFETAKGAFTVVTFPKEAPQTVEQIVRLVKEGFYNGIAFHRVVPGFVVQGGDPATRTVAATDPKVGSGGSGQTLPPEYQGQTVKYLTGTAGMARGQDPNSADSQFFVTLAPVAHLNGHYTVWGQVIAGMDVVKQLEVGDKIQQATIISDPTKK